MRTLFIAAAALMSATCAFAAPGASTKAENGKDVLAAADGRTLYVFDGDKPGESNCDGECLKLWPLFVVAVSEGPEGDWSVISRADGERQWAYKGRPLYLFARDSKAGETNGNSFNGNKWHIATP